MLTAARQTAHAAASDCRRSFMQVVWLPTRCCASSQAAAPTCTEGATSTKGSGAAACATGAARCGWCAAAAAAVAAVAAAGAAWFGTQGSGRTTCRRCGALVLLRTPGRGVADRRRANRECGTLVRLWTLRSLLRLTTFSPLHTHRALHWQGHGTFYDDDGSAYEGSWAAGRRCGPGRAAYSPEAGGGEYEGQWADDQRCGAGRSEMGRSGLRPDPHSPPWLACFVPAGSRGSAPCCSPVPLPPLPPSLRQSSARLVLRLTI